MARTTAGSSRATLTSLLLAFLAGALSVAIFQFGLAAVLHAAGLSPSAPYSMRPVPPWGVPQTISAMFWGGLWGIIMLPVLARAGGGLGYWLTSLLFGGIVVSVVLLFVVFPIKGRPVAAEWDMRQWARIFTLHAAFGLGVAFFLRLLAGLGRTG